MAFCPNCRAEYREEFTYCTDCGALLVAELPETDEEAQQELEFRPVKLAGFFLPAEADMLQELLEKSGIPSMVRGENDPIGVRSGAEEVAVLVDERDLERATEIYDAFFSQTAEEKDEEDESLQEE